MHWHVWSVGCPYWALASEALAQGWEGALERCASPSIPHAGHRATWELMFRLVPRREGGTPDMTHGHKARSQEGWGDGQRGGEAGVRQPHNPLRRP